MADECASTAVAILRQQPPKSRRCRRSRRTCRNVQHFVESKRLMTVGWLPNSCTESLHLRNSILATTSIKAAMNRRHLGDHRPQQKANCYCNSVYSCHKSDTASRAYSAFSSSPSSFISVSLTRIFSGSSPYCFKLRASSAIYLRITSPFAS